MIEVVLNDCLENKVRVKCIDDDIIGNWKKLVAAQTGTRADKIRIQKWYTVYEVVDLATSKEVFPICQFFSYLIGVINLVASSSKRHGQLRDIETSHIMELIDSGELETDKGKNQVGTLQHPDDT
ncbi:hypothetical protein J1N35_036602 [Gossypium stocksii]|uniref:Ubiquitin-like domain-containing protein n=1 Tax=Gossypium stocksii TaxID=47602 RepID=A0A9D3UIN7_9ROSI|nr:hypothetical protein J1N35_036602 [Gossypium stocksii]